MFQANSAQAEAPRPSGIAVTHFTRLGSKIGEVVDYEKPNKNNREWLRG